MSVLAEMEQYAAQLERENSGGVWVKNSSGLRYECRGQELVAALLYGAELDTPPPPTRKDGFQKVQAAVLAAAIKGRVRIRMNHGAVVEVNSDVAVTRVMQGVAELVVTE